MKIYLVGGAERDKLLNYPTGDRDWVVVGASPEEMKSQGYTAVGQDFPVFLHPETKEEYALARTERKTGKGYTGFSFSTDKSVSLEDDLARRDLTINAIAETPEGEIVDPYEGKKDLDNRILRHVSDAFCEDPVRILRLARFAARYHSLGFQVAPETQTLMTQMVLNGEVNHLTPERIWKEFSRALMEKQPWVFIDVLKNCGALEVVLPELASLYLQDFSPSHNNTPKISAEKQIFEALRLAATNNSPLESRFAICFYLLNETNTVSNTEVIFSNIIDSLKATDKTIKHVCESIKAPNSCKELSLILSKFYTAFRSMDVLTANEILDLLNHVDAFRKTDRFTQFLEVFVTWGIFHSIPQLFPDFTQFPNFSLA